MAYNELNFRVPDENGERPQNQPIDASAEASIMTSIDVIAMVMKTGVWLVRSGSD